MGRTATKRRPKALEQLRMQVDEIARRPAEMVLEELVTSDGEIVQGVAAYPAQAETERAVYEEPARETFGRWLIGQAAQNRDDAVGELAKMAKADRAFPRQGDAEEVRRRLGMAGADPDTFEALDDAEREYDRL